MRFPRYRFALHVAPVLAALPIGAGTAHAQAHKETAIQAMRLQVYGLGSYVHPQFGPEQTAGGFGVGGAIGFTLHHVHRIEPALDVRYTSASNSDNKQTVLGGGLRVTYHVAHFHPYGDFMFGSGNITFKHPAPNYTHDDSKVLTFGGGLDYDITQTIAIRGDFQQQRWQLSQTGAPFYPTQASIGLRYQFHFRNKYGPE